MKKAFKYYRLLSFLTNKSMKEAFCPCDFSCIGIKL